MPDVERSLRKAAQRLHPVPYWVLEKDYALGYLLSGMAQVPALSEALVLKGGTALRKFYFADYRFSEDLDFSTLAKPADIDAAMHAAADATRAMLLEEGPFEVALERLTLRDPHPGGQDGFTARVRFPNHREAMCRLKVEITHDEEVLMPPVLRSLLHPYPDPPSADWRCYALDEVIAEKLRALLQSRARLQARGWGQAASAGTTMICGTCCDTVLPSQARSPICCLASVRCGRSPTQMSMTSLCPSYKPWRRLSGSANCYHLSRRRRQQLRYYSS